MIAARAGTLGGHTAGQLRRLCAVAGLDPTDTDTYADVLLTTLGPAAERPLDLPPPSRTFLSDDHTPVEYSLSFTAGANPALRVLLEPGCGAGSLARGGRAALAAVREMARRWEFSTERLDDLEDLFLPPSPHGPLALWIALELRPGGVPQVKVYLNPAASGPHRAARTVREALGRLGHERAFEALPPADGYPFLALDLGDWEAPRVKVYLKHLDLSAAEAAGLCRTEPGPPAGEVAAFLHTAAGAASASRLDRRPGLTCHSFTETDSGLPSGFTLHIPVRDYVRDDAEALDRARTVLAGHGMDAGPLTRALPAVTGRRPEDGVGLIAYLALAHQRGRPPRVTAYVSSETYAVRPPAPTPERIDAQPVH
ncbi:tryptophan dimethylallyltransferase family protein [Streptomyces sp. NPDC028635]|uniref:tryptophan dimethylallyltransferase family protein n=1 Tax=Streptomyces sp. NPDC028635 TaxID=3154800 RepID=UPI0033FDE46A